MFDLVKTVSEISKWRTRALLVLSAAILHTWWLAPFLDRNGQHLDSDRWEFILAAAIATLLVKPVEFLLVEPIRRYFALRRMRREDWRVALDIATQAIPVGPSPCGGSSSPMMATAWEAIRREDERRARAHWYTRMWAFLFRRSDHRPDEPITPIHFQRAYARWILKNR